MAIAAVFRAMLRHAAGRSGGCITAGATASETRPMLWSDARGRWAAGLAIGSDGPVCAVAIPAIRRGCRSTSLRVSCTATCRDCHGAINSTASSALFIRRSCTIIRQAVSITTVIATVSRGL